jgi:peroxiredoxin Q/BCP
VKNQKKFHTKFGFKYDLLADENHEICEKFGFGNSKNLWEENLWEL